MGRGEAWWEGSPLAVLLWAELHGAMAELGWGTWACTSRGTGQGLGTGPLW